MWSYMAALRTYRRGCLKSSCLVSVLAMSALLCVCLQSSLPQGR